MKLKLLQVFGLLVLVNIRVFSSFAVVACNSHPLTLLVSHIMQTYKQHRSESRLGLMSFSGNDTESVMPAAEESYGSFQVMI